ncbi:hypothetical protein NHX12_005045 [Muraenolepis orangiensis]|uniref:Caspase-8 n=1 Tax=Muraenolepis orangiensis TaxID=630683 RepID=A0A9Q0E0A1_9TELE|nr:hypothetical protein NHX12_005045 [Muraenolepis orangiensis]
MQVPHEDGPPVEAAVRPEPPLIEASEEAIQFIGIGIGIEPSELQKCLFSDSLVTVSEGGSELGEFSVAVDLATRGQRPCLHLRAVSRGTIDERTSTIKAAELLAAQEALAHLEGLQSVADIQLHRRQAEFVKVLQCDDVLETFPQLRTLDLEHTGSTDSYLLSSNPTGLCVIINNENFQNGNKRQPTPRRPRGHPQETQSPPPGDPEATPRRPRGHPQESKSPPPGDPEPIPRRPRAHPQDTQRPPLLHLDTPLDQTKSDMEQVTKHLAALNDVAAMNDLAALQKYKLQEWSDDKFTPLRTPLRHGDAFVCCILSHGAEGQVIGVDLEKLSIKDITSAFDGKHSSGLRGKPKVFFIQACQGHILEPTVVMDDLYGGGGGQTKKIYIPMDADFLVVMATIENYQSSRNTVDGCCFIQSLCKRLRERCPRGDDIMEILYRVNDDVSQKEFLRNGAVMTQMSEAKHVTLRRRLVFSPCSS